jgi:hypothetical protein
VKSYSKDRVPIAVSYGDRSAQHRLVRIKYRLAVARRNIRYRESGMGSTIEAIYDVHVAQWFNELRRDALLAERTFGFM